MNNHKETEADREIRCCLDENQSFAVIAGAGSGKTTSLVEALKYLREKKAAELRRTDRNIVCITYTNRAVEVISQRLEWDELFRISTIHNFLWESVKRFTHDIKEALKISIIPEQIERKQKDDSGRQSQQAIAAREKVAALQNDLSTLDEVAEFQYNDSSFSDYPKGLIGHDDVIKVSSYLILNRANLQKLLCQKYPYIFVDEAQDTFPTVVEALNSLSNNGSATIGYFGDPMQQIYDKRVGDFVDSKGLQRITKKENFRCSTEVIRLLNAFRSDVQQFAAGDNAEIEGSVHLYLIQAESPKASRGRYNEEQTFRASEKYGEVFNELGWADQQDVKYLFLVRQMIARRLGFSGLHDLFTGQFSSENSRETYQSGDHYLLKPFVDCFSEIIAAHSNGEAAEVLQLLRKFSPAFAPLGVNKTKTIREVQNLSKTLISKFNEIWGVQTIGEILRFCQLHDLYQFSQRLLDDLKREPRAETFDREAHSDEKGDWLADSFFKMKTSEVLKYVDFAKNNTAYSTQHGVKGEEYKKVVVIFDDVEAAWNPYNFNKTLTPDTSGTATKRQYDKSTKLAYVCFSRAEIDLRVVLFTQDPDAAKNELINTSLFKDEQITVWN